MARAKHKVKIRQINAPDIKIVAKATRRMVGISEAHHSELTKLRKTNLGELSLAATLATVIDAGLKAVQSGT